MIGMLFHGVIHILNRSIIYQKGNSIIGVTSVEPLNEIVILMAQKMELDRSTLSNKEDNYV